ncbi:transcriptional regulator, IclR family [Rhizobiales bacterium GAS191]|nr:transcriptional regulator, IclR family [Rhizobiales bacterium GAS113]SED72248.1 transcriptional regulator, IclR family [Rhizobiales bacterium GAS191]
MTGLGRYARVLRLFDEAKSEWTVQEIAAALDVPASTVYRSVRELLAEGLLEQAAEAQYRLGAAFVEFDRLVRATDPLYRIGTALLREVALQARLPCVAVLARLYGDEVMCVADATSPEGLVRTSYERGRPQPLTRGATSKVILAQVPTRRLTRLLAAPQASAPASQAQDPAALRAELAAIRRRGYCVTHGEVDRGVVGIAAPVSIPERALAASLSLVVAAASLDDAEERRLVPLIVSSASLLTEQLNKDGSRPSTAREAP